MPEWSFGPQLELDFETPEMVRRSLESAEALEQASALAQMRRLRAMT